MIVAFYTRLGLKSIMYNGRFEELISVKLYIGTKNFLYCFQLENCINMVEKACVYVLIVKPLYKFVCDCRNIKHISYVK